MTSRSSLTLVVLFAFLVVCSRPTHAEPDKSELAQKAQTILKTNCYACHGQNETAQGGFNYVLNQQRLISGKKVIPGNFKESKLYKQMADEVMPPGRSSPDDFIIDADGHLYLHYANGNRELVKASPEAYERVGSFKVPHAGERPSWAHPVVANGKLYVREGDYILCYDVRAK